MPEPTTVSVVPKPQVIDKGVKVVEQSFFGGQLKGFSNYIVTYKFSNEAEIEASAKEILEKLGKKGLVTLFNSNVKAGLAIKARNEVNKKLNVPELDEEEKKDPNKVLEYNNKVKAGIAEVEAMRMDPVKSILVSPEDAEAYVPTGEKELTMQGALKKAIAFGQEAEKATDPAEKARLKSEANRYLSMLQELAVKSGIMSSKPEEDDEEEEKSTATTVNA